MDPAAILDVDVLQLAESSILLAMEHCSSDDLFQQLLSLDDAIEAVKKCEQTLTPQLRAWKDHGFVAEAELGQKAVARLTTSLWKVENFQTNARHAFNLRARPLLQNRGLLNLPEEMLLGILHNFETSLDETTLRFDRDYKVNISTIQNVRLTCRRLCEIGSHLLVPCIRVTPNLSSLEHLEQVASHPTISRGLRLFCVNTAYYSAAMAGSFQRFSLRCYEKVAGLIEDYDDWDEDGEGIYGSKERMEDCVMRAKRILPSWEPLKIANLIGGGAQFDESALALLRGYERYQELYQQQNEILQNGRFTRAVAEAAERSHFTVCLFISDSYKGPDSDEGPNYFHKLSLAEALVADPDLVVDPDLLIKYSRIHEGHGWSKADASQAGEPPQSILYELPLAMHAAGATLAGLMVDTYHPYELSLNISEEQISGFGEISKNLKAFDFRMSHTFYDAGPVCSPKEMKGLFTYLSAVMGPQNVPSLSLGLLSIHMFNRDSHFERYTIGPLLVSETWQRLETLILATFDVHLNELEKLVSMLKSGVQIVFRTIFLSSGTWDRALDCIRSKAGSGSKLDHPRGAECEDMTKREYNDIFEESSAFGRPESKATQYIVSVEGVKHPLRYNAEATEATDEP